MKKLILLVMCLSLMAAVGSTLFALTKQSDSFDQNIAVLSACDSHTGYCANTNDEECIMECPDCGELVYAKGYNGPASDVKGHCTEIK